MINVNQITAELAKMPDQALQQYAAMHKNDPYTVALALSESNRRKQMRMGAQGAGAMPQPKVVDQDIAQMASPPQQQPLPEESGIGQLPAQNMQNMAGGGIVAFDEGGDVPGYAGGVFTKVDPKQEFAAKYHDAAVRAGEQLGVDPGIIISQWGLETGWGKSVIPGTNNLGNIKDFSGKGTAAYDKAEKSTSKYRKYDSVDDFADDYVKLIKRKFPESVGAGSDVNKFTNGLRPGEKGGYATDESYGTKLAKTFSKYLPVGITSAQDAMGTGDSEGIMALANPPAAPTKTNPAIEQIPGQSRPAPAYKDENTYFGGLADRLGIPQDVQRNISNTLNATSGWTAPVAGVNRAASIISKGLEPTAEMIQKAEQAKQIANTERLLPPAKAGLEALSEESAATRAAAENARRMAQLEADRKAATGAQQSVEAATKTANIADKTAQEIAAAQDAARLNQAKMTGAAQGLAEMQAVDKAGGIPDLAAAQPVVTNPVANAYPSGIMGGAPQAETEEAGLESLLPTAEAPKKGGTDWNDLMLKLGLNLMASKDPNAISGVGQAGLATLGMQQAEEKAKSEAAYREAMGKHATMPSSEIQTLEWARDPNNMKLLRQIAQAKADPKASAQEALAFLKDAGVVLKETDPVLYNVLRNKVLGGAVPQIQEGVGTRS